MSASPTRRQQLVRRLSCLGLALLLLLAAAPSRIEARTTRGQILPPPAGVYYVGPEDMIADAINLAAPYLVRVDQPDLAQVVVINNAPLRDSLRVFGSDIQQGTVGLVLFCGPFFPQDIEDLRALLAVSTFGLDQTATTAPLQLTSVADPIQDAIAWRSAPEIQARTLITNPNLLRSVVSTPDGDGVIQRVRGREQTQALIVTAWFSHPSNQAWSSWAYFDYMIYHLIADAANVGRRLSFADYPPSPTPEADERLTIAAVGIGLILSTAAAYYSARRRLYLSPEPDPEVALLTGGGPSAAAWQKVGFHRPLAGLLTYLPLGLLLFVPLIAYRTWLLPDVWLTDAHGLATWDSVTLWTMALWLLIDAGTGVAVVRQYAAHHIRAPHRAVRYLQFYVWWQLISGALQLGIVCLLSAAALPALRLAHLTYYLLARAALQFPGFLAVFTVAFRARQRFNYQQLLNLFTLLGAPLLQIALIELLRRPAGGHTWAEAALGIGPGLTGALSLAGGIILAEVLTFLLGALLYHLDGQEARKLFVPAFDAGIVKELLGFGVPWAIGAAFPVIAILFQTEWLAARLTPPELPIEGWRLLLIVAGGFEILLIGLYHNVMPMLTEARGMDFRTLLRYTCSQSMRYGAWFSFFLVAALGAISEQLLSSQALVAVLRRSASAGPSYADAAPWIMAILAWEALRWTVWLPDRMLEAAGRPGLIAWLSLLEQAMRIGGGLLLIPIWGMQGLLVAHGAGLLLRAILARFLAHRYLVQIRIYVWQTLIAPAAGALVTYQLLRTAVRALLPSLLPLSTSAEALTSPQVWTEWGSTLVLASAGLLLPALLLYAFFTALFGGWDDGDLAELQQAKAMTGAGIVGLLTLSSPFAWLMLHCVRIGARLSPLHGRYPITLHTWAQEEANALTLAQMPPG
jgi:hypothetical protein